MQIDGNNLDIKHLGRVFLSHCFNRLLLLLLVTSEFVSKLFSTNAASSQQMNDFIMIWKHVL